MDRSKLSTVQKARERYWSSDFDHAFSQFIYAFEANPKAWWLAMEAIRCKRTLLVEEGKRKLVFYNPNYTNNPYQKNLYSSDKQFDYDVSPVNHLVINEQLVKATFSRHLVFHQHWLKDIFWKSLSVEAGIVAIDMHVGILKALKSFGTTTCWTLHNIIDHDATPLQEELSNYALRQMAEVSDYIFVHTQGAGKQLSSQCGTDFSEKFVELEHPLYDDLLHEVTSCLPGEIKQQDLDGRRILLSVGMIRPYKGVPGLIRAFQKVVQGNKDHSLHLIIAGQLQDPEVLETLNGLEESTRKCISLVARRLRKEELAGLMQLAHISVASYKKILTSGSYYLATTFAKPTVAPRKGMFAEIVQDNETGFLYDGTVDSLATLLQRVAALPEEELARVGNNALQTCKHLTVANVSRRFFSLLEADK